MTTPVQPGAVSPVHSYDYTVFIRLGATCGLISINPRGSQRYTRICLSSKTLHGVSPVEIVGPCSRRRGWFCDDCSLNFFLCVWLAVEYGVPPACRARSKGGIYCGHVLFCSMIIVVHIVLL